MPHIVWVHSSFSTLARFLALRLITFEISLAIIMVSEYTNPSAESSCVILPSGINAPSVSIMCTTCCISACLSFRSDAKSFMCRHTLLIIFDSDTFLSDVISPCVTIVSVPFGQQNRVNSTSSAALSEAPSTITRTYFLAISYYSCLPECKRDLAVMSYFISFFSLFIYLNIAEIEITKIMGRLDICQPDITIIRIGCGECNDPRLICFKGRRLCDVNIS